MSGEYSREQLEKMQKDAERRVMEMQKRSKGALEKESSSRDRPQSSNSRSAQTSANRFSGSRARGDGRFFEGTPISRSYGRPSSDTPHSCENSNDDGHFPSHFLKKPRLLELLNINKMLNDPDDRLVLLLIALLSGEKADPMLLLSLLYIIL